MGKITKTKLVADAWLTGYIRGTLFDALTPAQRMQFRMVSEKGPEAVARWASESLPKSPSLWHRLKNAERQRRFREKARTPNWHQDWSRATKLLGPKYARSMRRLAEQMDLGSPAAVLEAALKALDQNLVGAGQDPGAAQPPRAAAPHAVGPHARGQTPGEEEFA